MKPNWNPFFKSHELASILLEVVWRPWFFFFKTEWCLLSFQLSSLAQKFPAYCLFCWICAKIWKWIILTFPSLNWDPTIFCPPHSLLFYLFWTILQCKDFCCFHIFLWIEISPREVGQVEESSSTILYFLDNIAMEIFLIFHISLWIEIPRCEVGQGVAPNGCNCITEYEVEKDFQSLLKYLRKKYLKR